MSSVRLAQFQQAAVEHIVARLTDRSGSRRVLLADEVGLGKTIVARGVLEQLLSRRREPLTAVYLCSNAEIAEQNRRKLDPTGGRSVGRVTELALDRRADADLLLYSFTPATSLREGTGLAWERRLLLYLVYRIYGDPVWLKRWRNFFRCGAGQETWYADTTRASLRNEFERKTTVAFQQELSAAWRSMLFDGRSLRETLVEHVRHFDESAVEDRRRRNSIVGRIRNVMQRVVLRHLRPDLLILDEVQRFRDVLDEADQPSSIAAELFADDVPVLILSATPYRALTLGHEVNGADGDHYSDFFNTLRFLFKRDTAAPERIKNGLAEFGERLRRADLVERADPTLLQLRRSLEDDLRKVICRTERNWYVLDRHKGIHEVAIERRALPRRDELEDFLRLHNAVAPICGPGQVTEFWKSAPSPLTFLDSRYAVLKNLRENRSRVPRPLLVADGDVGRLAERNHRLQCLIENSLGSNGSLPHLWIRPTYRYYRDDFFGEASPRKLLVFSGWRFVPKTIAIVASRAAVDRLGGDPEDPTQPLKFSDRRSFHVFDVCFPAPALATIGWAALTSGTDPARTARDVIDDAIARTRRAVEAAGVEIVPVGGDSMWRVAARLEQSNANGELIRNALDVWQASGGADELSEAVLQHREWFTEWLVDRRTVLQLNETRLRMLAFIATFSPANAVWRALHGAYGSEAAENAFPQIVSLCLGAMRRYFNRPHVQQIVRRHVPRVDWQPTRTGREHGYAERVLIYSCDGHLQATLDEYAYLQRFASQSDTVEKAIRQLEGVWKLPRGTPRTNGPTGRGAMVAIEPDAAVHTTHFALAFGDDVSRDTGPDEEEIRVRKTDVREAFNSPFWPFVLATTSVGQEGLDFHLYCADVLHWNLPSNPVDLEQREGRINRRDSLAIRRSIARDWPIERPEMRQALSEVYSTGGPVSAWQIVFDLLEQHGDPQRYKHGLYPHWVYECSDGQQPERIRRHVPFFATSRDVARYERLKKGLALYRVVFGQANQEDLLERLQELIDQKPREDHDRILKRLAIYMLNLSPIGRSEALRHAENEAAALVSGDRAQLRILLNDVRDLRERHSQLREVSQELDGLVEFVEGAIETNDTKSKDVQRAVVALAYTRNPYDHIFDLHVEGGFVDDIEVVREAWRALAHRNREHARSR